MTSKSKGSGTTPCLHLGNRGFARPTGGKAPLERRWGGCVSRSLLGFWLAGTTWSLTPQIFAQLSEASLTAATEEIGPRRVPLDSLPANLKFGDFRLGVSSSLNAEWNDNIRSSGSLRERDLILRPSLQLDASFPLSTKNLLNLSLGAGYAEYVEHGENSRWFVNSGSGLSFDLAVEHVRINFHDHVEYTQDAVQEPTVVGIADTSRLRNTVGLNLDWDLNKVLIGAGYDHGLSASPSATLQSQDNQSDSLNSRVGYRFSSALTVGVEGAVTLTAYRERTLNDNTSTTAGSYAVWSPSTAITVRPKVGMAVYHFDGGSQSIATADLTSWYASLNLSHGITDAISYSIDVGRDFRLGIQSDLVESWHVRPAMRWGVRQGTVVSAYVSFESGRQGAGNAGGNLVETYDWTRAGVSVSQTVFKELSVALGYRVTVRSSDVASRAFDQNVVELTLTYRPL
jgi:hypothetical protein